MSDDEVGGFFLVSAIVLFLTWFLSRRKRRKFHGNDLDRVLYRWSPNDPYSVRDLLAGGLLFLGMSGTGKTSASGYQISRALVRDRNTFGLILSAKPEDASMWKGIFDREGQRDRLLVFDASTESKLRFNFLEEAGRYGSTRDITQCIMTIGQTLRNGRRNGGGQNEAFFVAQEERTFHFAVEVIKLAKSKVTASYLQQFISGAAQTVDEINDLKWRSGFHCQCLQTAANARKTPQQAHDFQQAMDYWCGEFPRMADRTRSSILAGVFGTLFVLNSGLVHELISTTTNFSFAEMKRRRQWLLVNSPPCIYGDNGLFLGVGFKYLMQRFILSQTATPGDPVHICWVDEAGQWTNEFDSLYITQSRSHRGCLVYLAQSVHSFHSAMKGEDGKHETFCLLSQFSHRILHAVGDVETAQWASDTLGRRQETFIGGSMQPAGGMFDELMGNGQFTSSFNTHYEPVLQPGVFLTELSRTGGPANNFLSDAIVIRPGRPFSTGENWLPVTFSQR
jgi:hypothetical protein